MEGQTYETTLPEGYKPAKVVDATDKKFAIILNVVALLIMIGIGFLMLMIRGELKFALDLVGLVFSWGVIILMFAVLTVHELLHGLAYKLLTKHKLSFGLTLSCAYCGVPDIYVYRTTALIALLTPFTVFTAIFVAVLLIAPVGTAAWDVCAMLFAVHTGGCIGDLYDTWLYMVHFREKSTLMRDTGPAQTFYVKE